MTLNSYSKVAQIWSLYFGDRTDEESFWLSLSQQYGTTILSAMSATGEMAAALASRGCTVTAVDFTREMIEEGRRIYADLETLNFVEGDLRSLSLHEKAYDFAFIGSSDFHHFLTASDQQAVLRSIGQHLRPGGGLALELWFPPTHSWSSPKRTFEPLRAPTDPQIKVWKEGQTEFDVETRIVTITQEIFIEHNDQIEQIPHAFQMQLLDRDTMIEMFNQAGFTVINEYGSYQFEPWTPDSPKWIVEVVRQAIV